MGTGGKSKGKGRSVGGRGGKGKGKNSTVHSIYQQATAFLNALQQDAICSLGKEDVIVVPGSADKIETVLTALNIEFLSVQQGALASTDLQPHQAVFVNCCANCGDGAARTLSTHIKNGGVVVTTDHEVQHLLERIFPDVVQHVPLSGGHDACLTEVDATHCASYCFPCGANWHIDGGAYGVKVKDPCKCKVLIKSPDVLQENIMLDIPHGKGHAIHLISHFEQVSRHMKGETAQATPAEIGQLASQAGIELSDEVMQKLLSGKIGFRHLQTAVAGITMLVNVLVLARSSGQATTAPSARPGGCLQLTPQEALYGLAQGPVTLHSDVSADGRVSEMRKLVVACVDVGDSFFPLKVAANLRRSDGHRETAICLLAIAALEKRLGGSIALPAQYILKEPGSLVRVTEWTRTLNNNVRNLPSGLKHAIQLAFSRLVTLEGLARVHRSTHAGLGMLIRHCHISEPKEAIAAILNKRYPETEDEWLREFGSEVLPQPHLFGERRRVLRDAGSVAVKMSKAGQTGEDAKEEAWNELLLEGKLTAKELSRNLVSILNTNLSDEACAAMEQQLTSTRFSQHVTAMQLFVAWRQVEKQNVRTALETALSQKQGKLKSSYRRIHILIDVSPSMSRPMGAGTSSVSCKEAAILAARTLQQAWVAGGGKQKGWCRVHTFPSQSDGLELDEISLEDQHCFQLALDVNGRTAFPKSTNALLPWKWLEAAESGESDQVVIITDEDFTQEARWPALEALHHGKGRTWWQSRCVNLRGTPGCGRGAEAKGILANGCDEAMLQRLVARPGDMLSSIRNLIFQSFPKDRAYVTILALKRHQPRFREGVLRHILGFAAPLRLEELR